MRDGHCAEVASGDAASSTAAMRFVVPVLAELAQLHQETGQSYLLYWQAVLQQCIGRIEPAIADFEAFLDSTAGDARIESLRADGERRLQGLRRGAQRLPTGAAASREWGPRLVLGVGAGWQVVSTDQPFHYLTVPVDVGVRIAGPVGVQVFARPSVSGPNLRASGAAADEPTVSWLTPFGIAATFRWPAAVRPFVALGVQLAVTETSDEQVLPLVGVVGQLGVELPLGASPVVLRPFLEPGSLGTEFALRAGVQVGVDLVK